MKTIATIDSCILYSMGIRSFIMWLSINKVFQPIWSETIHQEWILALSKNKNSPYKIDPTILLNIKRLMNYHSPHSTITDYEDISYNLSLPDKNDSHVLAAAIKSNSQFIVTFNLRDFPTSYIEQFNIKIIHPDDFLVLIYKNNKNDFIKSFEQMLSVFKNPKINIVEQCAFFKKLKLTKTADKILKHYKLCIKHSPQST